MLALNQVHVHTRFKHVHVHVYIALVCMCVCEWGVGVCLCVCVCVYITMYWAGMINNPSFSKEFELVMLPKLSNIISVDCMYSAYMIVALL